jgi:hypothetical protein
VPLAIKLKLRNRAMDFGMETANSLTSRVLVVNNTIRGKSGFKTD